MLLLKILKKRICQMNKRRIFSVLTSIILGMFCVIPPLKAVPPKEDYTPPYTGEAFERFCAYIRENPDKSILEKIEVAEQHIAQGKPGDQDVIDFKNPAKSICYFLRCKESEVYPLLKVEKRWFKKDDEKIRILEHFFKLVQHSKIQLGYGKKENETDYYTAEAFDRMMNYLTENKCQEPSSEFFITIEQIELMWNLKLSNKLLIDFSNPVPKLCEILKCSDEKELTELLQLQCKGEGLFEKLSPKDKMLNNFFELVRDAKQKILRANP